MTEQVRDRSIRSLPTAHVRHGRQRRSSGWRTVLSVFSSALAVVLVSGASVAAITLNQLDANIDEVILTGANGEARSVPTVGEWEGGFNVLIVGVDNAEGQQDENQRDGATLNDVNILVHVAEDQQSAIAVSIPRDLVVPIPECPLPDGRTSYEMSAQPFNTAFGVGGLNCVVLTAEALTGLEIPYAGTISFDGVAMMSTAVGGVDVCVDAPVFDPFTGLDLPTAGTHTVEGYTALAFLRTRYGVGDGSDLSRISSQQVYMSSLMRTLQSGGTLTDPTKLYGLAQVATKAMSLSSSLASIDSMVSMALVLKDIPTESITFVQYPATTGLGGVYTGKAAPVEYLAEQLFEKIRNDEPFLLAEDSTGNGAALDPSAPSAPEPAPSETSTAEPGPSASPTVPPLPGEEPAEAEVLEGVLGQTAAQQTCSVAN
ncbi:MAG: LCP family protein [Microcella sp.]|uniref:LCP family protein n=1 Tax=Microcella sp. TaxID=1913979 RepID=UPI002727E7F3|nr:LCP family protein [Microcella sp.]MDO8337626.1 LCP family protein [Microcella sp.]